VHNEKETYFGASLHIEKETYFGVSVHIEKATYFGEASLHIEKETYCAACFVGRKDRILSAGRWWNKRHISEY
jgi:hypothetical protein